MKKTTILLAAVLSFSTASIMAGDDHKHMKSMDMKSMDMKMKMMDKDGDGMISKTEFMDAHEMMFDQMKNSQGMISVEDMQKMKRNMMQGKSGMPGHAHENMNPNPNQKGMMGNPKP